MTVSVVEPSSSGHRLYYVRVLAQGADRVEWVTTAAAASSPEAQVHLRPLVDSGRLLVRVLDPWPGRVRVLLRLRGVVAVPDGDRWLGAVLVAGLLRRASYRVLLMRPDRRGVVLNAGARGRRLAKSLALQAISTLTSVRVYGLVDAFGRGAAELGGSIGPVADPVLPRSVPSVPSVSRAAGLVVGLLGAVDVRKNPALVARACAAVEGARLVVVGGVSAEALAVLAAAGLGDRLSVDDRYVDEDELTRVAAGCDVIAVLYDNHDSSSGVLALAAQVGVPVLVPYGSRLAATAGDFGLPTRLDVAAVVEALGVVARDGDALRAAARTAGKLVGTQDFVDALIGPTP